MIWVIICFSFACLVSHADLGVAVLVGYGPYVLGLFRIKLTLGVVPDCTDGSAGLWEGPLLTLDGHVVERFSSCWSSLDQVIVGHF